MSNKRFNKFSNIPCVFTVPFQFDLPPLGRGLFTHVNNFSDFLSPKKENSYANLYCRAGTFTVRQARARLNNEGNDKRDTEACPANLSPGLP